MTFRLLLTVTTLLAFSGPGPAEAERPLAPPDTLPDEPRAVVLDQPDAPLTVAPYETSYDGVRLFQADGIRHEIRVRNTGDRRVVAAKFVFVMFSVFNDVIGEESGVLLSPLAVGARLQESWTTDPPNASTYHIGVVYVAKVRFGDGTVWSADAQRIDARLRRIDEGGVAALRDAED
jgi:hypothetical protein